MRIRLLGLVSGLALFVPLAAFAEEPGNQQEVTTPAAQQQAMQVSDPVICHYYYHEGTVIPRQYCRTRSAWTRYRIRQQADITEFQMRTLTEHE